ncbi:uncharacterized protein LOC116140267 isoform X2 [Pistacia vera]|uniref:uncharacterized protein LOC116140267 isoform X2 n=1 Tax=Pistacia vera TaxID=55513 RepID=UPI0012633154|nr:uncharacterized protein LOC116140267 isoform X2 [Pistacia vera]
MESSFHYSHPVGVSDSNARAELLDIILMKVIGEADFQRNRDLEKFSCRRRPGHVRSRNSSSFFVECFCVEEDSVTIAACRLLISTEAAPILIVLMISA